MLIPTAEAAKICGVDARTILRYVREGIVQPESRGKHGAYLFRRSDLDKIPKPVPIPDGWMPVGSVVTELGVGRNIVEGWIRRGQIERRVVRNPRKKVLINLNEVKKMPLFAIGQWPRGQHGYGTTPGRPSAPRVPGRSGWAAANRNPVSATGRFHPADQPPQSPARARRRKCASCGRAAVPSDLRMLCRNCYKNKGSGVFDI